MTIPEYLLEIIAKLEQANFEAYLVGGSVRDFLMTKTPQDWDITTNARPEEILGVFPFGKYENTFGTVLIPIRAVGVVETKETLVDIVEVTTYRSEQGYEDRRHPDKILFEIELDKDLERRDFTINALALKPGAPVSEKPGIKAVTIGGRDYTLVDLFGGEKDIKKQMIRAVGEPELRFKEDALRMMRAVRFVAQLGFELEPKTQRAITKLAGSIKFVSKERIHDEFIKILKSDRPEVGVRLLHECKLLQYIIPELEEGVGMAQNHHHVFQVFEHNILSLKFCPSPKYTVRLAALLHDIAKPKTRRFVNGAATFYNHEYVGAKMVDRILTRLKFSTDDRLAVVNLVKNHMFYYQVGEVTETSVRRLIAKTGRENLKDLIDLRVADRLGSGTPTAMPYKLKHLQYMMEKVQNDPVSVKMLKINGDNLMAEFNFPPGPIIGALLDVLLSEVLEDPQRNTKEYLLDRARQLQAFNLEELRAQAQEVIQEKRIEDDQKMKSKYLKNKKV